MKIIKIIFFFILFFTGIISKASSVSTTPVSYINTIYATMLCGTGSTSSACANPVVLGTEASGSSFDLSSITAGASAGSIGNLNSVGAGQTFSYMQIILSRDFTMQATGSDGTRTCYTAANGSGGTAASGATPAIGSTNSAQYAAQVVTIPDSATLPANMHGTSNIDGTTSGDAAAGASGTNDYVAFIITLTEPYTKKQGKMPQLQIAFSLTGAADFDDTGAACLVMPSSPSVTVTFVE
jgi:hypothetical protein